jgi:putative sterol carrier protein
MLEIISKIIIDDKSYSNQESRGKNQDISIDDIINGLPTRLKTEKAEGVALNVLIEFENDLKYSIEIKENKVIVSKSKHLNTYDLIITTTSETYIAIETGKLNPQEAFMSGKVQVSDIGKMMQFGNLFRKLNNEMM